MGNEVAASIDWVLGSRSPRRQELLQPLLHPATFRIVAPLNGEEPGFERLARWSEIESRLREIARLKSEDVAGQLRIEQAARGDGGSERKPLQTVICADTTVIVGERDGELEAIGQPPETENWRDVVRDWFRRHYLGKTHRVATCLRVTTSDGRLGERVVVSKVTFGVSGEPWLDWYLATGESRGKAGGYAIQGAGGLFVSRLEGSLSNVVGLPTLELMELLDELGLSPQCPPARIG